jgi:YceI-like domain
MKYFFLVSFSFIVLLVKLQAQSGLQTTKNGQISFFSKTPLENIDAVNNEVSSILNTQTGDLVYAVLIKGFHFQRALMEEHFNENYMESSKIPKSTFTGKIVNLNTVNFTQDGTYAVTADGDLTLHGVKKKISIPGSIVIKAGKIQALAKFKIKPQDYNIKIPAVVANKIAGTIDVSVDCKYESKK